MPGPPSRNEVPCMCFDADSQPPIAPIAGAAVDGTLVTLTAADGNTFSAFHAVPATPGRARMLILPDVRGLFRYYEELALRFAEAGIEALAIDYFGRTAGLGARTAELRLPAARGPDDLGRAERGHRGRRGSPARPAVTVPACSSLGSASAAGWRSTAGRWASTSRVPSASMACPIGPRNDIPAPVDIAGNLRVARARPVRGRRCGDPGDRGRGL